MNRSIVYRIYPTAEQKVFFEKTFDATRFAYNQMLTVQESRYLNHQHHLSKLEANEYCNHVLKNEYPWLREVDKFALTNAIFHLEDGYQRLFQHKGKHPRYKNRYTAKKSYSTNRTGNNIVVGDNYVRLPKVGRIKASVHRHPPDNWLLKYATVTENPDGTFQVSVSFFFEDMVEMQYPDNGNTLGLDYMSDGLYMDSNGDSPDNYHRNFRESQKKLRREQRRMARKQGARKGEPPSNNYQKQKIKVAKLQRHVANKRRDFLQKDSTKIANQYFFVCVEDLNLCGISNNEFRLGK
jgi:putative transposase